MGSDQKWGRMGWYPLPQSIFARLLAISSKCCLFNALCCSGSQLLRWPSGQGWALLGEGMWKWRNSVSFVLNLSYLGVSWGWSDGKPGWREACSAAASVSIADFLQGTLSVTISWCLWDNGTLGFWGYWSSLKSNRETFEVTRKPRVKMGLTWSEENS